jgi:hypothetical protein
MTLTRKRKGKAAPETAKVEKNSRQNKGDGRKKAPGRGARKGEKRGGRKAGVPNKRTLELRAALEAAGLSVETHPVVMMYRVYTGEITMPVLVRQTDGDETWNEVQDVPLEPALRVRCMAEVAQYLEPKRKAVEMSTPDGKPLQVTLVDSRSLPGWLNDPRNPWRKGRK